MPLHHPDIFIILVEIVLLSVIENDVVFLIRVPLNARPCESGSQHMEEFILWMGQ